MSATTRKALLLLLLLAGLLFRLQFVAHDMRDLVTHGPLYDDSFYCFEIARNIASGRGSTFDGLHPTNGYQPLYVLFLVPLYWLTGGHATAPIYAALAASALLNVLTGWILFRLLRRYASDWAAFFGLLLWSFGPAIVRQSVNGLETALAMFLVAACIEYYLTVYRPGSAGGARAAATLGLLVGLSVLARVDALLFAVALGADALWRGRRREMRRLALAAAVAAGVLLPWCIASHRALGSVYPESGSATRLLSEVYAPHDHPEVGGLSFANGPPARFLLDNLALSVLQLGASPVLQVYTRCLERLTPPQRLESTVGLWAIGSLMLCMLLAPFFVTWRRHRSGTWAPGDFGFLFVYSSLLLAAYSCVVFGQIFYSRYYYPVFFFSVLLGGFAFDILLGLVRRTRPRRVLAAAVLGLYALALPYMCMHRVRNYDYRFLNAVDWIAAHTPPGATIGVFNSGAIGYFSDRRVINLDGKVNPAALRALRNGRVSDYVRSQRIDYVIDHQWILARFHLDQDGDRVRFARLEDGRGLGVPGWVAYRVERVAPESGPTGGAVASRLHP